MKNVAFFLILCSAIISIFFITENSYAITPAEGQAAFDSVFWGLMSVWALGLSFGLAVKLINRS